MVGLPLLQFAGFLFWQAEIQSFIEVLFNGAPKQTIRIMYSNESSDWLNSIVTTPCFQQHIIQTENFDVLTPTYEEMYYLDTYFMLVLMTVNFQSEYESWYDRALNYRENTIWLMDTNINRSLLNYYLTEFPVKGYYYHFIIVDMNDQDGTIQINRYNILEFNDNPTSEIFSHRESRFNQPGALFDYLFKNRFAHFGGHQFIVYGEPDVPKVALVATKPKAQKYVVGSDVSMAIMIGRYLNASIRWITGWENKKKYAKLPIKQRKEFFKLIKPTIELNENYKEKLQCVEFSVDVE